MGECPPSRPRMKRSMLRLKDDKRSEREMELERLKLLTGLDAQRGELTLLPEKGHLTMICMDEVNDG